MNKRRSTIRYNSQGNKDNNRIKTHNDSLKPTQKDLQTIYSKLTYQSILKNYNVNNLRPYSSRANYKQIKQEINTIIPKKQSQINLKDNLKIGSSSTRISKILQKQKNKLTKKRKKRLFYQSQIHDQQIQIAKTYLEDVKQDLKQKKATIQQLENKINLKYPGVTKKFTNVFKKIHHLAQGRNVSQNYIQQQPSQIFSIPKKDAINSLNKNDVGFYSISKQRAYSYYNDNNQPSKSFYLKMQQPPSRRKSCSFYYNYLKKYSIRKQLITNQLQNKKN